MKMHALAIILTLACGIGVYSGVDMGIESLFYTRDKILHDMNLAALEVQILPEDTRNLPDLSKIPGIKKVERRLVLPGVVNLKNNARLTTVLVFMEQIQPEINKINIIKGENIDENQIDEALVEKTLNNYYKIEPGETIEIKVGEKLYKNKVAGIGVSPEYIINSANPEMFLPEKGSLGVVFTSLKQIENNLGFTMVNDLLFTYKEGYNPKIVQASIIDTLKHVNLERVIPYEDHFSYKYMQIDLNGLKVCLPAIVFVLGVLSFIITFLIFNRLIQYERREIGAIMAQGYSSLEIIKAYAVGAAILCILSLLIGIPFSFLVRNIFSNIYINAQSMIYTYNIISPISILKGVIFAALAIGISFYIPLYRLLKLYPREIIHPVSKNNFANNLLLKRLLLKLRFLPIGIRMGIINIFRNPTRIISTLVCIALSIGVAISYTVNLRSILETVKNRLDNNKWHLAVDFLYPVYYEDYEELKKISGIKEMEPYFRHYVEIENDKLSEGSSMLGLNYNSNMKILPLIAGRNFKNSNEIVLSTDLIKKLNVKVGDEVKVKVGVKKYSFTVSGIKSDVILGESFIDFYRAREIFEFKDEASGIFIKTETEDKTKIEKEIYKKDFVAKVTLKETLVEKFLLLIEEKTGIVNIATIISVFVALLFIFTSINLGATECAGEYATLKAIGYGKTQLRLILFSESIIIGILGALGSVPIGMFINSYISYLLSAAWYKIDAYYFLKDFALGIIPMLILIPISILPALKFIDNLNIATALKAKIIE